MSTKQKLFLLVKIISTVLIASAIILELWNLSALITNNKIPGSLNIIFWIERFAIAAHFLEGVIATIYANSRNKMPLQYGVYTFFVGTIGLLELFSQEDK
ncbi:hypothetical protein A6770_03265 [Nostoc minutum NIES-26]|uniref:Uncharacterized protein n=1 Tax=Nostoc minutum NIES-26 TaxID=1844469 RepID=A0A367QNB8_9NOSO|nr:hypothetical protein A6770_03265 [Nostoc minutum NIES-26]